jgi:hypothetical protein
MMDYYEILGVSRNASQTEIRNAYRKLAKLYHPDRNSSEHAKTYIQLINEAYETLSDPQKRSQYDQPAFTFVTQETTYQPQKDPLEEQRKENFRRWQERERIKRQEEEGYKLYAFTQFKKFNIVIALWALLLVADEYILPPRVSNEAVQEARSVNSGRRGYYSNFIAKTDSYIMAIPVVAVEKSAKATLKIEASRVLNIPLQVITPDGTAYEVRRTVLAFIAPIPLILLIVILTLYWIKEPSNWATFAISIEGISILTIVALWLISMSDRNAF